MTKEMTEMEAREEAANLKISTVGDFKSRIGGIHQLPSGLVVRLRNPGGIEAFLGSGTIPNMLMPIVSNVLDSNKGEGQPSDEEIAKALSDSVKQDATALAGMAEMLNQVAAKSIVEPQCHPVPKNEKMRKDTELYADEVSMGDKQYIFSWIVSGAKELEPFRSGSQ